MTTVVVAILVALLLFAALRLWITANRLDRLHVAPRRPGRLSKGALARRIVATRAVAVAGGLGDPRSDELRRLADLADNADRDHRADAENDLSRALATMPAATEPDLAAELADASERVLLARRFYNDAVRDTRALRGGLVTRVFRLAGRAAMPEYFEIAEVPHRTAMVHPDGCPRRAAGRCRSGSAAVRHRPTGGFALVAHPGRRRRGRRGSGPPRCANWRRRPASGFGRGPGRSDLAPGGPLLVHRRTTSRPSSISPPGCPGGPTGPAGRRSASERRRGGPAILDGGESGARTMVAAPGVDSAVGRPGRFRRHGGRAADADRWTGVDPRGAGSQRRGDLSARVGLPAAGGPGRAAGRGGPDGRHPDRLIVRYVRSSSGGSGVIESRAG